MRAGVSWASNQFQEVSVAKPNYSFEKRQRELEKKKKKEEKTQRKLSKGAETSAPAVVDVREMPAPE